MEAAGRLADRSGTVTLPPNAASIGPKVDTWPVTHVMPGSENQPRPLAASSSQFQAMQAPCIPPCLAAAALRLTLAKLIYPVVVLHALG